jgi:hypothetical protein
MTEVDPVACALFLMAAFVLAGFAQVAWLATTWSHRFAWPLDGGLTLRGKPLFGANKTMRGFLIMVPATAMAFALVSHFAEADRAASGLWPLTPGQYALVGAWAGFGFMAGELPNSLVKRQLDIPPGAAARQPNALVWQYLFDRLDSGIGMLTALSVAVPTPWQTWALVLALGPALHWSFSALMFRLGAKSRIA